MHQSPCAACARLWSHSEWCFLTTQQCGLHIWKEKKKTKGCKEHNLGGMCLKMSPPSRESTVEQEGMMPGGLRDLIVKNCQRSKSFNSSHYTIHRLPSLYIPWITKGPVWKTKLPLQCFLTAIIVWCIISKWVAAFVGSTFWRKCVRSALCDATRAPVRHPGSVPRSQSTS